MNNKPTVALTDPQKQAFSEGLDPLLESSMMAPKINTGGLNNADYTTAMMAITTMMRMPRVAINPRFIETAIARALPPGDSRNAIQERILGFFAEVAGPDGPAITPRSTGPATLG